jgi:hypothetical protein
VCRAISIPFRPPSLRENSSQSSPSDFYLPVLKHKNPAVVPLYHKIRFSILIPLFLSTTPFAAAGWWLQAFTGENCSGQEVGSWVSDERHPQCEDFTFLVPIKSIRADAGADGVLQASSQPCDYHPNTRSWYIRNECVNAGSWGEWKSFLVRLNL